MIEWIPITNSSRVVAAAYSTEREHIYARFPDGVEWCYESCPVHVWETFMAPNTSKGAYIRDELDHHVNYRHSI